MTPLIIVFLSVFTLKTVFVSADDDELDKPFKKCMIGRPLSITCKKGIAQSCPRGSYCNIEQGELTGSCCQFTPILPTQKCPYGMLKKICKQSRDCPRNYYCNMCDKGGFSKIGKCCRRRPVPIFNIGRCPRVPKIKQFGSCLFRRGLRCMKDKDCKYRGQKCCDYGCGKICMYAIRG